MKERLLAIFRTFGRPFRSFGILESYGMGLPDFECGEAIVLDGGATYVHSPLSFLGNSMGRLVLTNKRLLFMSMYIPGHHPGQGLAPRFSLSLAEISHVELGGWKVRLRGRLPGVSVMSVSMAGERESYAFQFRDAEQWVNAIQQLRN